METWPGGSLTRHALLKAGTKEYLVHISKTEDCSEQTAKQTAGRETVRGVSTSLQKLSKHWHSKNRKGLEQKKAAYAHSQT